MSNIFIENCLFIIQIYCSMFRLHERDKICKGLWTETQREPTAGPIDVSELLTDNFFKICYFLYFYISEFRISLVWCHLAKLLRHLTGVSIFTVFINSIKLVTRHESILSTFGLPMLVAGAHAWTFQFDLHFRSKILANLTMIIKWLIQSTITAQRILVITNSPKPKTIIWRLSQLDAVEICRYQHLLTRPQDFVLFKL